MRYLVLLELSSSALSNIGEDWNTLKKKPKPKKSPPTRSPKLKAEVGNDQRCLVIVKEITIATWHGDHVLATQMWLMT